MSLRVAFVGGGHMARHHLRAVQRLSVPATVVGVHDAIQERANEFATLAGCQSFPSYAALLGSARPDIVHVCTPPHTHVEVALTAVERGAHVYVEKPFAPTVTDARVLLDAARARHRLVGAGHQLLRDPAFARLLNRAAALGAPVQIDSHFAFRPVGTTARTGAATLARHLIDILPHPLYALVALLEHYAPAEPITCAWVHAEPGDLHAVLRAGSIVGRLSVSLRARPVASSITLTGTRGSLTCDFVRSTLMGVPNPGTEALEKVLNPVIDGARLISGTGLGVVRRLRSQVGYPGLAELLEAFYRAVEQNQPSPVSPSHLLTVTALFQDLVARVDAAVRHTTGSRRPRPVSDAPLVVVTGARGFLGAEICRALPRVRGIGRAGWPDGANLDEWMAADLSQGPHVAAVTGASVVIHAAAETSGGFAEHQRNTVDATRHLLDAMQQAGVRRLVLVSSLSVLQPPRTPWEQQDERTPRPADAKRFGPYTWGKCLQEALVEREAARRGIAVRIVRPGALVDWRDPSLPGLLGRRLFGRWHLGLGRPGLPIAICDVDQCARVVAMCATHFDEMPPVINLIDPAVASRRDFLARLRQDGWNGRVVWIPISVLATGVTVARAAFAALRGQRPSRLSAWAVLKPRRYDATLAASVLEQTRRATPAQVRGVA